MYLYGTSSSPLVTGIGVGTGADAYSDLITNYTNTLADGSTASFSDKLNAWVNLGSLCFSFSSNTNPESTLYQTNKSDYQRASNTWLNSDFAKQVQQVSDQFSGYMYAHQGGGGSNFAQTTLNALNSFSPDEQKMIFYGQGMEVNGMRYEQGGSNYYNSLDDWRTSLTQQSAAYVAQQSSASTAPNPAGIAAAVTTGTATIKASSDSSTADTAAKSAVTSLTQHGGSASAGSIALQVLLNSQEKNTGVRTADVSRTAKAGTGVAYATSPAPLTSNAAQAPPLNQVA